VPSHGIKHFQQNFKFLKSISFSTKKFFLIRSPHSLQIKIFSFSFVFCLFKNVEEKVSGERKIPHHKHVALLTFNTSNAFCFITVTLVRKVSFIVES